MTVNLKAGPAAWPLFAALVMLAMQGGHLLLSGPVCSPDIVGFEKWSDGLIAAGFKPFTFLSGAEFQVPPVLYLGWVGLVALAKLCFGQAWPWALAALNCLAVSWLVFLAGRLVWRLTASRAACAVAILLPFSCFAFWLWPPYLLSDSVFAALCLTLFYLVVKSLGGERARPALLIPALVLAGAMLFFRPTALPAVLWLLAAPVFRLMAGWKRADQAGRLVPAFLALAACVLLAAAWLLPNLGRLGLAAPDSWPAIVEMRFQEGVVVRDRPDTYHAPPQSYADSLYLTLDKFRQYFAFWRSEFSTVHNALNAAFFIPAYLLALAAVTPIRRKPPVSLAAFLSLAWIITYAVFQSAQYIDYDWRYRLPVLAPLVILAGLGAARLWRGRPGKLS